MRPFASARGKVALIMHSEELEGLGAGGFLVSPLAMCLISNGYQTDGQEGSLERLH